MAHLVGEEIGWPETMQSLIYQETLAGYLGRVSYNNTAFGVAQVKPDTARFVRRHFDDIDFPEMSDADLIEKLKNDDLFNMRVGARYFVYCLNRFEGDWRRAVVAYNQGHNGARRFTDEQVDQFKYLVELREKLDLVRKFNLEVGISQYAGLSPEKFASPATKTTQRASRERDSSDYSYG